jgi:hypothetical protein
MHIYLYSIGGMMAVAALSTGAQSCLAEKKAAGIMYLVSAGCNAWLSYCAFMYASSTWH